MRFLPETNPAADAVALLRSGLFRPLSPRHIARIVPHIVREGLPPHLTYVLNALEDPHRVAIASEAGSMTWGVLFERVVRLANHLSSHGVRPGDAVAIMLPNRQEFIETEAAALLL